MRGTRIVGRRGRRLGPALAAWVSVAAGLPCAAWGAEPPVAPAPGTGPSARGNPSAAAAPSASEPHVAAALAHLRSERAALGLGASADFAPLKLRARGSRHFVRLGQTHAGIPVFGAEATVQLDDAGKVVFVLQRLARNQGLDRLATSPRLAATDAEGAAVAWARRRRPEVEFVTRPATLEIFAPDVLGLSGAPRLVWDLEVGPRDAGPADAAHRLLLDASDGGVVRAYPLSWNALDRDIYDAQNTTNHYQVLARREGWPPYGLADVDQSYDYLGDVYNFYAANFGRDGIDDLGMKTESSVRDCELGYACPYQNAFWSDWDRTLFFGDGWAVDDVTAHEFTHGVTAYTSGLIYENASGALNESISDMFGEFVDLTNGRGNDDPSVRWLCGEDLAYGTLRDMRNPPALGDPDRLGSPLYIPPVSIPNDSNDQGGVHTNSGVSNKLCSLLVDGGSFNGEAVAAMGIPRVAALMYETNAYLLTSASGWTELYYALGQAAVNLGWSAADRDNLRRACAAVEISILWVDQAAGCVFPNGGASCGLFGGPYATVGAGVAGALPGTRIHIRTGNYPETAVLNQNGRFEAENGTVRIGP